VGRRNPGEKQLQTKAKKSREKGDRWAQETCKWKSGKDTQWVRGVTKFVLTYLLPGATRVGGGGREKDQNVFERGGGGGNRNNVRAAAFESRRS